MERLSFPNREDDEVEYDNPPVADGINAPDRKPLRDLFANLALVAAAVVVLFVALDLAARYLTPLVPHRWERALAGKNLLQSALDAEGEEKQREIRRIAAKVADTMELPADLELSVCYNPGGTVNAFATFGGNIVIFQGLLNVMQSEDELAMVLAHEIAHVKHRDVIKGMVRALGLMVLSIGLQDGGSLLEAASGLGLAGYSRMQETEADLEAVKALGAVYGHGGGAREFFQSLAGKVEKRSPKDKSMVSGLTASHPDTLYRLERCREEAIRLGLDVEGELTPLPSVLAGIPGE